MHELSIAMSILDRVAEESDSRGGAHVLAVHLQVGPLSGVVTEALAGAYDMARQGTEQADCELLIEQTPITVYCEKCGAQRPVRSIQQMCCEVCGTPSAEVTSGRELLVTAMEIES